MLEWLKTVLGDNYSEDIDKAVSAEIGKGFVSKHNYDERNEAYKGLQLQIAERDKQLEELRKVDSASLQAEITRLQEQNKKQQEDFTQQINELKMNNAIESALKDAGAKNLRAVKALLDSAELKLNEDGTVEGLQSQIEALVKANDSGFLFASSGSAARSFSSVVPAASGEPQQWLQLEYSRKYSEAKTPTEKIKIKREAYENGVLLN